MLRCTHSLMMVHICILEYSKQIESYEADSNIDERTDEHNFCIPLSRNGDIYIYYIIYYDTN